MDDSRPPVDEGTPPRRKMACPAGLGTALAITIIVLGGAAVGWLARSCDAEGGGRAPAPDAADATADGAAGEFLVLSYDDFGPAAASTELLGVSWYQWESHGHDQPYDYNIKVVVYRDGERQQAEARFPIVKGPVDYAGVDEAADYRYVECGQAIAHLKGIIAEIGPEDGLADLLATLRRTLARIEAFGQSRTAMPGQ